MVGSRDMEIIFYYTVLLCQSSCRSICLLCSILCLNIMSIMLNIIVYYAYKIKKQAMSMLLYNYNLFSVNHSHRSHLIIPTP